MKRTFVLITLIFLAFFVSKAQSVKTEQDALKKIQAFYFIRDYESGADMGERLSQKFPDNTEIKAWFVLNMARAGKSKEAVEAAEKLVEKNKEDIWALFALANSYIRNAQFDKALPISEKLLALAPENEEIILLYTNALLTKKEYAKALDFLDKNASKINDKARLMTLEAEIYYRKNEKDKSFSTYAHARKLNPNDVNAFYASGFFLNTDKRFAEAIPILKRAVELSPSVFHIREQYWESLYQGQPKKTQDQRKTEVAADINTFLKARPATPKIFEGIVSQYRKLELSAKQKVTEDALLAKFPQTVEAEKIIMNRLRRFDYYAADRKIDELKKVEYVKKLWEFINRPQHFNQNYVGEVYTNLLYIQQEDKKVSDADYLKIADRAVNFNGLSFTDPYATIAVGLIKRGLFVEAEKFAESGLKKFEARINEAKKDEQNIAYLEFREQPDKARILNLIGEALLKQKKHEKAEKVLLESTETSKEYNYGFKLLGELYENTNQLEKAEDFHISYFAFMNLEKPNYDSLKNIYQKRKGSADGFENYLENVKKIEKSKRRELVVSKRNKEPKDLVAFNLKTLGGKSFSSDDLKEKVVVINIWATWCGPCVKEMPELQQLYKKYIGAKDVTVITIDSLEELETIKKFMSGKKYDFPVLLSGDYFSTAPIDAYPTTWFVDKQGKIAYTKVGYSKSLLEEFDWRIEELRK
jgi:thiol-disulfide isomerase/thioredoxin/Tfp pilus assembly protein PilF